MKKIVCLLLAAALLLCLASCGGDARDETEAEERPAAHAAKTDRSEPAGPTDGPLETPPAPSGETERPEQAQPTDEPFETPAAPETPEPESISLSQEELLAEIDRIREYYYSPTDADSKTVLSRGTDGWNYSREYYFHDGELVFAFIYDGTEEHRLYFKDRRMIRYIDENHTVFDFGALEPFSEWETRALREAGQFETAAAEPADWLGVWVTGGEEWIQVTGADENGVSMIFHHSTELGAIDTEYTLPYLSSDRRSVAEDESLIENGGWRYAFYLEDGYILVTSRYPDKLFFRHEPVQP